MYLPLENPANLATESRGSEDIGTMDVLGHAVGEGFGSGLGMSGVRALQESTSRTQQSSQPKPDARLTPMSEEDWRKSEFYRKELKYEPTMTPLRAEWLAGTVDKKDQETYVNTHWHGAFAGTVNLLGNIAGTALDPTMYVPLIPEAATAWIAGKAALTAAKVGLGASEAVARGTRVAANMATQAITNGVLVGAATGLDMQTQEHSQQTPDWHDAVGQVGIAALFGAGFGAVHGFLSKSPVEARVTGLAKAMDDGSIGKPLDVAKVFPEGAKPNAEAVDHALTVLKDDKAPIDVHEQAVADLGLDPKTATPEEVTTKIRELGKDSKVDFTPLAEKEFKMQEYPAGENDFGVSPEEVQRVGTRFADLEANEATAPIAKSEMEAVKGETLTLDQKAKAYVSAAMCIARELI